MPVIKVAYLLVLVSMAFSSVNTLECYTCAGCNDEFDAVENAENTDTGCTQCVKQWIEGVVARSCGIGSETIECSKLSIFGIESTTCYCDSDLCNGSVVPTASFLALVIVAVMKFIL